MIGRIGSALVAGCFGLALSATALAAPVASWSFELPSGGSVGDPFVSQTDSVNGLTATGVNGATYGAGNPAISSNGALNLSGGAYARVTDAPLLTGHNDGNTGFTTFTIDLYLLLPADPTTTMQIVRKTGLGGNNTPGFELFAQPGGKIGFGIHESTGTTHTGTASGKLIANQWQHIVAHWNGTTGTVSIDGVDSGIAVAYSAPFVNTDIDMGIGALIRSNGSVGQQLTGSIDALTISGTLVPEPASAGVLALGGLALAARRRGRSSQR